VELAAAIVSGVCLLFPGVVANLVGGAASLPLGEIKGAGLVVFAGLFALQWMRRRARTA
jgi:membrane protein implicated in regulation of membrane protease activity